MINIFLYFLCISHAYLTCVFTLTATNIFLMILTITDTNNCRIFYFDWQNTVE